MQYITVLAALPLLALAAPQPQFSGFPGFPGSGSSQPDNSKLVEADLNNVKASVVTLNDTLNTIEPDAPSISFGTLITLLGNANNITDQLNKTTDDINSSSNFNGADAVQIGLQNIDLSNTVQSLLTNFQCHVQAFRNQGAAALVAQNLQTAEDGSSGYSNAASAKVGVLAGFAPLVSQPLIQKFDQTIALYNGSSNDTSCGQSSGFNLPMM